MTINCLIVDDESLALQLLESYIQKLPHLELVGKCENGAQAMAILASQPIDLLFLDIQMPELTGLDLIRSLKNPPVVVLTTAYAEYALDGFDLDVQDYLLKPFPFERFLQAVDKATRRIQMERSTPEPAKNTSQPSVVQPQPTQKDYLFVKADHKHVKVRFEEIQYVEGLREYVRIQTTGRQVVTYQSLKNMEKLLPENGFIRVHKSFIISVDRIKAIQGNMVEIGEKSIPIGSSYRKSFFARFDQIR